MKRSRSFGATTYKDLCAKNDRIVKKSREQQESCRKSEPNLGTKGQDFSVREIIYIIRDGEKLPEYMGWGRAWTPISVDIGVHGEGQGFLSN